MNRREKLADWISGGALTRARRLADCQMEEAEFWYIEATNADRLCDGRLTALRAIAAMETPSANATVKRMAKTAREALNG